MERIFLETERAFDEVIAGLEEGIGVPDMAALRPKMDHAASFEEFEWAIGEAVGSADLMQFLRLDLGGAMKKDPTAKAYRIVRIIAGNPLIMKQMVEHVPHAGSYAPVTILVYEREGKVHLCYDTMESVLAPYGNMRALKVARELDAKVTKLLKTAAGEW